MLGLIRNIFGRQKQRRNLRAVHVPLRVRGRYDAAVTTDENRRHWANADLLSADAAANPRVRSVLRSRARYEVANNSYAKGIVSTLANDCIGTGPRLQMLTDEADANRVVELEFLRWADSVSLAEKLRTMRMARSESGEVFAMLVANPRVDSPVKLDLRLIEADQITTPDLIRLSTAINAVDGIVFDAYGNPVEYHVLKSHPGDSLAGFSLAYDRVPAASMIHYFRADRPGQSRGIPEITPALPLFAQLRRYTLAVLAAAETAADFAAVLYTDAPANGEADPVEPMDLVELERRMATVLPGGWRLGQIQAQQPSTSYGEFKKELLNEIARCLSVPYNVAACNSSGYNYASGRLDHQTYFKSIRVDQVQLGLTVLDRVLRAWLDEAILISGLLPLWMRTAAFRDLDHQWFWDRQEHVDPSTQSGQNGNTGVHLRDGQAETRQGRRRTGRPTLQRQAGRVGGDWREAGRHGTRAGAEVPAQGQGTLSGQAGLFRPERRHSRLGAGLGRCLRNDPRREGPPRRRCGPIAAQAKQAAGARPRVGRVSRRFAVDRAAVDERRPRNGIGATGHVAVGLVAHISRNEHPVFARARTSHRARVFLLGA